MPSAVRIACSLNYNSCWVLSDQLSHLFQERLVQYINAYWEGTAATNTNLPGSVSRAQWERGILSAGKSQVVL
jgi:hypothetical protein